MSTLDTPLSAAEGTPLSAITSLSAFTTPQSHRPANASPSAFPSTTRRSGGQSSHILSMYSTQDRVVLDLGVRFIRAGFSGEPFPRCCIDATAKSDKEVFWEEENWDGGLVEDRLERALREIYSVYLLIDSKNRKAIVSEETLVGYRIKEGICRVLFTYFQVPSVTFLSSHVLSLASTGLRTGIVIDIGWHHTRILPIYELRPLNPFIQVSPIACKALHSRLKYLLEKYTTPALSSPSFNTIEDFLVRALYVPPHPPAYPSTITTGLIPNHELQNIYDSDSTDSIEWFVPSQKQDLQVPRWIPSCTAELFFEGDRKHAIPDTDELGLTTSVLSCLLRLPKDVRAKVIQAVVVVGGGAAIPGLRTRLQNTLETMWLEKFPKLVRSTTPEMTPPASPVKGEMPLLVADLTPRKKMGTFRFVDANPLEATFVGGSLLGDVKVKGLVEVTREGFNNSHGRGVLDWSILGGRGEEEEEESKRKSRG